MENKLATNGRVLPAIMNADKERGTDTDIITRNRFSALRVKRVGDPHKKGSVRVSRGLNLPEKGTEVKLTDIGHAIRKRWWIIVAVLLLALLVSAIVVKVQDPVYRVEIAVSATAPINPTTKLPDALTQTSYIALMPSISNYTESLGVAEAASKRLSQEGIDIPPQELLRKVSAVPEANSTSVKITFSDSSPTRVADIANAWGEVLVLKTLQSEANEFYDQNLKTLLLNGNLVFTNRAVPPTKPSQPKSGAYLALGAFVGLLLGLGLAVVLEFLDPHFRSASEAEEILGLPVLGTIPREKGDRALKLLPYFGEGSPVWEAYSELRSGIILTRKGEPPKSILAVPAIPFETGPAVAANLAASIANTGRRTVLLDCDLRDAALSRLLEAERRPGISDALEGGKDFHDMVLETGITNLYLVPAGKKRENSTDLLSLKSFSGELQELEGSYDQLVLYAPPLAVSMDGAVVAAQVQACLVIIDIGLATREVASEAMHNLRLLGVVPTGVVLANVKIRAREIRPTAPAVPTEAPSRKEPSTKIRVPEEAERAKERADYRPARQARDRGARERVAAKPGEEKPDSEAPPTESGVVEEFRRMGEIGSPIPKTWLRALNSDQPDVRESATRAITAYYHAFLRRYRISQEDASTITESIIRMVRREGEFAEMSEAEAQRRLQDMLVRAGARLSGTGAEKTGEEREESAEDTATPRKETVTRDWKRKEKRRFRLPAGNKKGETGDATPGGETPSGKEDEVDWE